MKIKKSYGEKIFDSANYTLLTIITIFCIYPFLYVLFASLSDPGQLMTHDGLLLRPMGFNIQAYVKVLQNPNILTGYANTLFYVVVGTALNIVLTILAGYCLSRKWLYGRSVMIFFVLFTMFFSGGMIPSYLLVQNLGMYDTRWAILIPQAIKVYNVIITKTYFEGIPDSLEEAARIDGANDFQILRKIALPLSKTIVAVNVLFYAVGHWNSWFDSMLYLQDKTKWPLQMFLRDILLMSQVSDMASAVENLDENIKYAVIIVTILPIICVYPFLQKYFVKGVMVGAVKG